MYAGYILCSLGLLHIHRENAIFNYCDVFTEQSFDIQMKINLSNEIKRRLIWSTEAQYSQY